MPPVRALDDWAASRAYTLALSSLKGTVIGIDATHYLHQHLHHPSTREPLLIALGGFPFALSANIERELKELKELGIGFLFVFDGLQFGVEDSQNRVRNESRRADSARAFEQAWDLYDRHQADQVVDAFSNAGNPEPTEFYRFLQRILYENNIDFFVAPYSAAAQLKYFESALPKPFVDFVWGSTDALLFDVEKVILKLDLDASQFLWISKDNCKEELGRLTNEQFLDFGLLLGSRFLRTFPPFENSTFPGKPWNIRDALNIFNGANRHATTLCSQFEDDRRVQDLQYLDRFKRAYMSIKHHVITDNEGRVGPLNPETAPSDVHELIGQRLPEELYYYIARGVLGSSIPNYLTSGQLTVPLPFGVEDSDVYRRLAGDSLMPVREQAVGLLSNCLHRFYQTKIINVRLWYEENSDRTINLKTLPSVRDTIRSWRISHKQLPSELIDVQTPRGSLKFAAESLKVPAFVSKTFASKESVSLSTEDEILHQALLGFLQLRGYVNSKHELTDWGKCFNEATKALESTETLVDSQIFESIFIAVEMLRMGVLGPSDWFPHHSGGPMRGSEEDKSFNLLVSRVACIGKLKHKPIGYSGPLSRQLLSFRSLVSTVRRSLRELVEVVITSMLLSGEVDRNIGNEGLTSLGFKLPFIDDNDCGLGIAVRTYLDDLLFQPESSSPKTREEVRAKGPEWFQHSESFEANLDSAFTLWDAVYAASQNAPKDFKGAKTWEDANKWLATKR